MNKKEQVPALRKFTFQELLPPFHKGEKNTTKKDEMKALAQGRADVISRASLCS